MRLLFLIWVFIISLSSSLQESLYSKSAIVPTFQEFYIGMTYKQVVQVLKNEYKACLQGFQSKYFTMSLPIYKLVSISNKLNNQIDFNKKRIYYDDETFFDLKNIVLDTPRYSLKYEDPFYLITFNDIKSIPIDYPTRVNKQLLNIKFKFFRNVLYAIEYSSNLKNYQLARVQSNYLNRYGINLRRGDNTFENDQGRFFIHLEGNENKQSRFILMGRQIYQSMSRYLDSMIFDAAHGVVEAINKNSFGKTYSMKVIILQSHKNALIQKLRKKYKNIDFL